MRGDRDEEAVNGSLRWYGAGTGGDCPDRTSQRALEAAVGHVAFLRRDDNQEGDLINVLFPVMASSPNMSPGAMGVFTRVH
jgi:hypothetical protein